MKHLSITVTGRVQGVFFRAATQQQAHHLGIMGWVRNNPDGSVRIEAEGDHAQLDTLLDWLQEGPPEAAVDNVHSEAGPLQHFPDFSIR